MGVHFYLMQTLTSRDANLASRLETSEGPNCVRNHAFQSQAPQKGTACCAKLE